MTVVSIHCASDVGRVRPSNEDVTLVAHPTSGEILACAPTVSPEVPDGGLLIAVADGMGGANGGEALRLAIAHAHAHRAVRAASATSPTNSGMGSTVVAELVTRTIATVAVVGDPRAYVLRRERLFPLTRDQALVDAGALTEEQARESRLDAEANTGKDNITASVAFIDGEDLPSPKAQDLPPRPPSSRRFPKSLRS